jgi:hypothetical protein
VLRRKVEAGERVETYHHTPNPVRVPQSLVDDGGFVVEGTVHRQVVTALQWNSSSTANLIGSNGTCDGYLTRHTRTTHDGLVEFQRLDHRRDGAHVRILIVSVVSGDIVAAWERPSVSGQVECDHGAFLPHSLVVHDTVILSRITSRGVEEDNLLRAVASGFVENLRPSPDWRVDVDIAANDVILVCLGLFFFFHRPMETVT